MTVPRPDVLRLGTLNVGTLAGRVATVLALCATLALDFVALQETRVPAHSRASVEAACRKSGWICHLDAQAVSSSGRTQYGTAILARVPVSPFALPPGLLPPGRGSAVRLHRPVGRPLLVVNVYLPAHSAVEAAQLLRGVFSYLAQCGDEGVVLGDFNLTPEQAPISDVRSLGAWRLPEETLLGDAVLPPTRRDFQGLPEGRCIDFALSTVGVPALSRDQLVGPADHDLVAYSFSVAGIFVHFLAPRCMPFCLSRLRPSPARPGPAFGPPLMLISALLLMPRISTVPGRC